MKTRLTLQPGQNGTKRLVKKYGERLIAVRYRYDPPTRRRVKTVELLEEELPWDPSVTLTRKGDEIINIRIGYQEAELRQRVKSAGARWLKDKKLWSLRYDLAQALGIEARIVE